MRTEVSVVRFITIRVYVNRVELDGDGEVGKEGMMVGPYGVDMRWQGKRAMSGLHGETDP